MIVSLNSARQTRVCALSRGAPAIAPRLVGESHARMAVRAFSRFERIERRRALPGVWSSPSPSWSIVARKSLGFYAQTTLTHWQSEATLVHSHSFHPLTLACLGAIALSGTAALAQQRPDSGTTQQQPERQIQTLPELVAPTVTTTLVKRAFVGGDVKVTPSGFRFTGNTLIPEAELQAVVGGLIGKEVDFNGLADAAASLRQLYTSKGYVLTDVYFPEQQFSAAGGIVEFAVIEARMGTVSVKVADGSGVSQAFATALAKTYLVPGALLSQGMLDKPVLLLRDMAGTDAEATVIPGASPGEANVEILVTPHGARYEPYVSADNMGARSSGEYRVAVGVTVNAPLGMGDVLVARAEQLVVRRDVAQHPFRVVAAVDRQEDLHRKSPSGVGMSNCPTVSMRRR